MSFVTNYSFTPNKIHLNNVFTESTFEKWYQCVQMGEWSRIYFELKKYDFQYE
jgi:hypothetical protein